MEGASEREISFMASTSSASADEPTATPSTLLSQSDTCSNGAWLTSEPELLPALGNRADAEAGQASDGRKHELGGWDDVSSTAISSTTEQRASPPTPEWIAQRRQVLVGDSSRQNSSRHSSPQRSGVTHGGGAVQTREMGAELASPQRGGASQAGGAVWARETGAVLGGEQSLRSVSTLANSVEGGMEGRTRSLHGQGQRAQTSGSAAPDEEPRTPVGDEASPMSRLELLFGKPSVGGLSQQVIVANGVTGTFFLWEAVVLNLVQNALFPQVRHPSWASIAVFYLTINHVLSEL